MFKCHKSGVNHSNDHNCCNRTGLDHGGYACTDTAGHKPVIRYFIDHNAQFITGNRLHTIGHKFHTENEQTQSAEYAENNLDKEGKVQSFFLKVNS